jgi:molybdate transport system substrate-binding protein
MDVKDNNPPEHSRLVIYSGLSEVVVWLRMSRTVKKSCLSVLCCLLFLVPLSTSHAREITLAVANSTCNAIKRVAESYMQQHEVTFSYICKSSGRLAKGLKGQAITADIYISANRTWMDFMIDNELVSSRLVTTPWGNSLVVAVPDKSPLTLSDWNDLASDTVGKILLGDPGTAPFGRYAKQAMEATGLWSKVKNKVATRKHITLLAETLAKSDDRTVGILFRSNVTDQLRVIYPVDKSWHTPIRYYIAPLDSAADEVEVIDFLMYIQGEMAKQIFSDENFEISGQ